MNLQQIRKEYDRVYQQIVDVIKQMGGEQNIKYHRQQKSPLYRKLKELQRKEHYLDALENRIIQGIRG